MSTLLSLSLSLSLLHAAFSLMHDTMRSFLAQQDHMQVSKFVLSHAHKDDILRMLIMQIYVAIYSVPYNT